ncbi:hypothetical protein FRZ61_44470 [Hypericibacter adhaerens]|jgi:lipid-A-disaccharide synthase-like uncharacterized protein|uniref:Zinc-ribbon domain-containing protein n=1 Tax=Hypericibacter adhaerens TaxID=2602016 RepID=A0A5J6NA38_9PROT|nr:hypothetical protein [Hypericibacter adhaerens]QEX24506.1 hypothetical protein FRZ61_44470 [Hypericibacter adhaerens]HVY50602.1 hypothetical protein [Devosia sp.]
MGRPCPHCGQRISRIVDECPYCGTKVQPQRPWYIWILGGIMVLILFLWLGDPASLGHFAETLFSFARELGSGTP